MRKTFWTASIVLASSLALISCKEKCTVGEKEIPCKQLETYNTFKSYEAEINATFGDRAPNLSLEEKLALRERIVSFYDSNSVDILAAFDIIAEFGMKPAEIYDMRKGEIDYFSEEIEKAKITQEFLKKLSIETFEKDTCFYEECTPESFVVMEITNTTDSTLSSIAINKNYEQGGELIVAKNETFYLLSKDQISPALGEDEDAVVKPGSKLTLSFRTSEEKKAKPEIKKILFAKK